MPLAPLFIVASVYAVAIARGLPLAERIRLFSRGAGDSGMMLMIWILCWPVRLPPRPRPWGLLTPRCSSHWPCCRGNGCCQVCFCSLFCVALHRYVGGHDCGAGSRGGWHCHANWSGAAPHDGGRSGRFVFGDNLSFISDTTVVSTRSQGCSLSDKFKVNFRIVLPAAILSFVLYLVMGSQSSFVSAAPNFSHSYLVLPYLAVLVLAILGVHVLAVLVVGNLLTGIVGVWSGRFSMDGWLQSSADGIGGMGELMLISMLAGGMLEIIRYMGGIDYMMRRLTRHVSGPRAAELSIGVLVGVTNVFTANNTVAILSVGGMAREISQRFGVDPRKSASLLDTFSCLVQGVLPYGAQLLMAGGLAGISPVEIIPYLYYPLLMGVCALLAIWWRYPRKFSRAPQPASGDGPATEG